MGSSLSLRWTQTCRRKNVPWKKSLIKAWKQKSIVYRGKTTRSGGPDFFGTHPAPWWKPRAVSMVDMMGIHVCPSQGTPGLLLPYLAQGTLPSPPYTAMSGLLWDWQTLIGSRSRKDLSLWTGDMIWGSAFQFLFSPGTLCLDETLSGSLECQAQISREPIRPRRGVEN